MKRLILLFVLSQVFHLGFAQDKLLTIDNAIVGQWRELYPKNIF